MGRQIVNPSTDYDRLVVVEGLARRLHTTTGDWRKYGEGADRLLALALVVALGPETIRAVLQHLSEQPSPTMENRPYEPEP